jgi:uncharacterized DUF497 family protein
MRDGELEWDDAKARINIARHDVLFEMARNVFADPFALDWFDDREDYGEARYVTLGLANHRLLQVAYALRDNRIRIISARAAAPQERRIYHEGKT